MAAMFEVLGRVEQARFPAGNCCKFFQLFRLMVDTKKSFEHFVGVFLTLGS